MNTESGYFYLNLANEWPTFLLSSALEIAEDGTMMLRRLPDDTFALRGTFRGGPFEAGEAQTNWYRLRAFADEAAGGAHIQLFSFTGDGDAPYDPTAENPFADSGWRAAPLDLLDLIIPNEPARRLWIGGLMRGDGASSPAMRQMRVTYGRDTYLKHLPAIYRKQPASRDFLERLLSLHESALGSVEQAIDDLPRLFDPLAAPLGEFPSWFNWLAGWLDFDLNERWPESEARAHLAEAFQLYGYRGTVGGMKRYLDLYAGVKAHIEEPGQYAVMWSLGESSTLGFTTRLAPGQLQGAVVGASATLGGSRLAEPEHLGTTLFEDVAHKFCVSVYCAELTYPGALAEVQAVVEREKPAHTIAHVCVIEPRLRVGVQARVGIDAIVASGPPQAQIGLALDSGVLAEHSTPCDTGAGKSTNGIQPCQEQEDF